MPQHFCGCGQRKDKNSAMCRVCYVSQKHRDQHNDATRGRCYLCDNPPDKHSKDCLWRPVNWFTKRKNKSRVIPRCPKGTYLVFLCHSHGLFHTNLAIGHAICPEYGCRTMRVVYVRVSEIKPSDMSSHFIPITLQSKKK